jgi:hypothetical protein
MFTNPIAERKKRDALATFVIIPSSLFFYTGETELVGFSLWEPRAWFPLSGDALQVETQQQKEQSGSSRV